MGSTPDQTSHGLCVGSARPSMPTSIHLLRFWQSGGCAVLASIDTACQRFQALAQVESSPSLSTVLLGSDTSCRPSSSHCCSAHHVRGQHQGAHMHICTCWCLPELELRDDVPRWGCMDWQQPQNHLRPAEMLCTCRVHLGRLCSGHRQEVHIYALMRSASLGPYSVSFRI